MDQEFEAIISKLQELLAVEELEYHNKTWLSGSDSTRSIQKQSELNWIVNRLRSLSSDVKGNRPNDTAICTVREYITSDRKMRQG